MAPLSHDIRRQFYVYSSPSIANRGVSLQEILHSIFPSAEVYSEQLKPRQSVLPLPVSSDDPVQMAFLLPDHRDHAIVGPVVGALRERNKNLRIALCSHTPALARLTTDAETIILLPQTVEKDKLVSTLCRAFDHPRGDLSAEQLAGLSRLVGNSTALCIVKTQILKAANVSLAVLITGESGTGKEVCARAIHHLGPRKGEPFMPLQCGAAPTELLEDDLFGHKSGAYTGANVDRKGLVAEANGGTLFLDEIDSLPFTAQSKLLRLLEDKEFRPLGSSKHQASDFRIITATNSNLSELVQGKQFRQDLFFRISVLHINIPPLRERVDDIPALITHFLTLYAVENHAEQASITEGALHRLMAYSWPGNVRELKNVIFEALTFSGGKALREEDIRPLGGKGMVVATSFRKQRDRVLAQFTHNFLRNVLALSGGNISRAAVLSGLDRSELRRYLRRYSSPESGTDQLREPSHT